MACCLGGPRSTDSPKHNGSATNFSAVLANMANLPKFNESYDLVSSKVIGSGNFGVAKLAKHRATGAVVAVKFLPRGDKIDHNVAREILNHRQLRHPHIIGFREVLLTESHLCIVMEYASGGELFDRIVDSGSFKEAEARYFFQQLISGVEYCHSRGVCHRDLKLENALLDRGADGNGAPRLKICDFGYSKSSSDSDPKTTVGTPAYIAPEVLQTKKYDGYRADVWCCGVTLFVMLVGAYPFEDPDDPKNFKKSIMRICSVKYSIPSNLGITAECQSLLASIFVANPEQRITIAQIKAHPWFQTNLPSMGAADGALAPESTQTIEQIQQIVEAAAVNPNGGDGAAGDDMMLDDDDFS